MKEIFVASGILALIICYIPQLRLTFKLKSSKNQSPWFWLLLSYSIAVNAIVGIWVLNTTGDWKVLVPQAFNLVFSLAMLAMVTIYPDR